MLVLGIAAKMGIWWDNINMTTEGREFVGVLD
jgi:hypothetical protein